MDKKESNLIFNPELLAGTIGLMDELSEAPFRDQAVEYQEKRIREYVEDYLRRQRESRRIPSFSALVAEIHRGRDIIQVVHERLKKGESPVVCVPRDTR